MHKAKTPLFILSRDGIIVAIGLDQFKLTRYIHSRHSFSFDWACENEGYSVAPYTAMSADIVGKLAKCAETGEIFTIKSDGFTFNYAQNDAGEVISDAGVDIRERRELLDHSKPFGAYCNSAPAGPPSFITGWKGNKLMTVVSARPYRLTRHSYMHGSYIYAIQAIDVHGAKWYGRGNCGMCITMRAYGSKKVGA